MTKILLQPSPTQPEEKGDSRALPRRTVKLSIRSVLLPGQSRLIRMLRRDILDSLGIVSVRVVLENAIFFNASPGV